MISTTPRFINKEEFFNYTGKDLSKILQVNSNESNAVDIFLMNVEDDLLAKIDDISFRLYDWDQLSEYQLNCLKKAIIKQAEYIIRSSDLFKDSGYDPEKGIIVSRDQLESIMICPASAHQLHSCGLLNHVIRNRHRFMRNL